MTDSKKTKGRRATEKAKVWLKPNRVEQLRDAAYLIGAPYLQQRNELFVQFIYDIGLRVGETVQVQKDFPVAFSTG